MPSSVDQQTAERSIPRTQKSGRDQNSRGECIGEAIGEEKAVLQKDRTLALDAEPKIRRSAVTILQLEVNSVLIAFYLAKRICIWNDVDNVQGIEA